MLKKTVSLLLALSLFGVVVAADYLFPSSNPPGGKTPDQVKQYVLYIFDDNAYSGKDGTQYEDQPGGDYANSSWVGGHVKEGGWIGTKPNELNLHEGDMGMSWAAYTLAGFKPNPYSEWKADQQYSQHDTVTYNDTIWQADYWPPKGAAPQIYDSTVDKWVRYWSFVKEVDHAPTITNPDGSPIHFTFNVISGLFVPTWPKAWESRESKFGYWVPSAEDYPDGKVLHTKIARAWGREMMIWSDKENGTVFQEGYINEIFQEAKDLGHEIGNHTIDHMESNSPLPNDEKGFGIWGGEGFDNSPMDTMPWGEVIDEAAQFGQTPGAHAQTMGWKIMAGDYISQKAWGGAIKIAEDQLKEYLGISVADGNLFSFRAPRLEVSSGLYYALDSLGYLYDCGLEEGYEANIGPSNMYWPYTVNNGSPNAAYQKSIGERVFLDSMPQGGLWEIPSNVVAVPTDISQEVYNHHAEINAAAPDGETIETYDEWKANGCKITAYDFNVFILWGMTKAQWLATMKYDLDQRMAGNKAPFHYGCHTDYYTPIYDNATLLNDFNKSSYGLVITKGWNTWKDRVEAMEEFRDYALSKGAYFVTGSQLINKIKEMQKDEEFGTADVLNPDWEFYNNSAVGSTTDKTNITGNISATINIAKGTPTESPTPGYGYYFTAGDLDSLDHISLTYKTNVPIAVRLTMENDAPWEVILSNCGPTVQSGRIPLSAFHYNQYDSTGHNSFPIEKDINGIEIELLTSGDSAITANLEIKDLTIYRGKKNVGIASKNILPLAKVISLKSFTKSALSLNLKKSGIYSVKIISANGKMVKSVSNREMAKGINTINLDNLSSGVYMISIKKGARNITLKSMIM